MNTPKTAPLTVLALTLALLSGCAHFSKKPASAPPAQTAPATASAPAPEPASAAAAPAPVKSSPVIQDVNISSTPSGASVSINGTTVGATPIVASLVTSENYTLTVAQSGYVTANVKLHATRFGPGALFFVPRWSKKFPSEVKVTLVPAEDKFAELEAAVADLDYQLKEHKITQDEHNKKVAEAIAFYSK